MAGPDSEERARKEGQRANAIADAQRQEQLKQEHDSLKKRLDDLKSAGTQGRWTKLEKDGTVRYGDQDVPLWDAVNRKANELKKPGLRGFDNFGSSMMELIELLSLFVDAAGHDMEKKVGFKIKEMGYALWDKLKSGKDAFTSPTDIAIPELVADVKMKDDNTLEVGGLKFAKDSWNLPIKNAEGKTVLDPKVELEKTIKVMVPLWLAKNGYKTTGLDGKFDRAPDPTASIPETARVPLTKAAFEKLRDDKDIGLGAFLAEYTDLKHEVAPSASPS